jgi:hypothetical protein
MDFYSIKKCQRVLVHGLGSKKDIAEENILTMKKAQLLNVLPSQNMCDLVDRALNTLEQELLQSRRHIQVYLSSSISSCLKQMATHVVLTILPVDSLYGVDII